MRIALLDDIALIGRYDREKTANVEQRLKEIGSITAQCDFVVANLEAPLTQRNRTTACKGVYLRSSPCNIGDKAFPADEQNCRCGCKMPVVDRIEGRSLDYIQSKSNGRFTSIYLSLVSADFMNSVKKMQFIQNDVDSVDVYIETDESYCEKMNGIILSKLHYSLGEDMEIRIHRVDSIEKDPSGKFRFLINRI